VDDQGAAGFPFVVGEIISSTVPRAELKEAMATHAVTLSCLDGPDGQGEYWCAQLMQPVQRRIEDVDRSRYDADYVGVDEDGMFAWTHYIALRPHVGGEFGLGAQGVVADLAYVVDASLGADTVFDSTKVDWVATVVVDGTDAEGNTDPEPQPKADDGPEPPADVADAGVIAAPSPREQLAEQGAEVSAEHFRSALDGVIATLADLTGNPVAEIPRPVEVAARKHSRYRGKLPSYSFDGTEVRYHTVDPIHGPMWRSSADPDEALYWMADDVTCSMAWSWAQRTPSARTMDPFKVRWLMAVPMWLTLITALDVRWAGKTRVRISEIRREAQRRGPKPPQSDWADPARSRAQD
jgi:hypothetical protein